MTVRPMAEAEIDWLAIRTRLAASAQDSAVQNPNSDEQRQSTLRERARALAQKPESEAEAGEEARVITFRLESSLYAVEARYVWEVLRRPAITPLPGTSAEIVGLTNFHGEILPVFDLRAALGHSRSQNDEAPAVIAIGNEHPDLAVVADEVLALTAVDIEKIRSAFASDPIGNASYLLGVSDDGLILLDGATLLKNWGPNVDSQGARALHIGKGNP